MAPNLLVKAAFVRGLETEKASCDSKIECDDLNSIRTNYLLQNVFSHLIKSVFKFRTIPSVNLNEENVLNEFINTVDTFRVNYETSIQQLCSDIEFNVENLGSVLHGVSNELFCEGITWSRIVALFAFVGELTLHCLARNYPVEIVDIMYNCFSQLVKDTLMNWITDHGGWEGIKTLTESEENEPVNEENEASGKGWAKTLLHNTVRMIGTLAHIANSTG